MSQLYEKITHGDRRTIVRRYKRGTRLMAPGPATLVLKANVALKVTQEYDANHLAWLDVIVHTESMVETGVVASAEDEKQAPLPKAEAPAQRFGRGPSIFTKLFGWLRSSPKE